MIRSQRWLGRLVLGCCLSLVLVACAGRPDDLVGATVQAEGAACTSKEDCPVGENCLDGVCTAACAPVGHVCDSDGMIAGCCAGTTCSETAARCVVPAGGACTLDAQCDDGSQCIGGACTACTGGACGVAGAACTSKEDCAGSLNCLDGQCSAQCAPLGHVCDSDGMIAGCCGGTSCSETRDHCVVPDGGVCSGEGQCDDGSACIAGICTSCSGGACGIDGAACTSNEDCRAGLGCLDGACTAACAPLGHSCSESTRYCCGGTQCDHEGSETCVIPIGGACTADSECKAGAACVGGACFVPDGGACGWDGECKTGSSCNAGACTPCHDGVCVFEGGACTLNVECANGLSCVDGVCSSWCGTETATCDPSGAGCCEGFGCFNVGQGENRCFLTTGSICGATWVCQPGDVCTMASDGWTRCLVNLGGACTATSECVPGATCNAGVCFKKIGRR